MPSDKIILMVEDDLRFGKIVIDMAHQYNLKAVVASNYLEVFDFISPVHPDCHNPGCEITGYQRLESAGSSEK